MSNYIELSRPTRSWLRVRVGTWVDTYLYAVNIPEMLSKIEADIGLLIVRGVNNEEIAKMRGVKLGTIKSQTHSLMVKAGVKSRVELLSLFMDEFIDIGATK